MSHARKLVFDGAIMTSGQIGAFLISIFFTAYILRILTKEEVALTALPIIFEGIISLFKDFGLATTAIKMVPQWRQQGKHRQVRGLLKMAWYLPLGAAVTISVVMWLGRSQLAIVFLRSETWADLIPWVIGYAFAGSMLNQQFLLLQALQKFKVVSGWSMTIQLGQKLVSFLFLLKWGVTGYLVGLTLVTWLGIGGGLWLLRKHLFGQAKWPAIGHLVSGSLPYYLSGFARYLFYQADQLVVALLLGPVFLAIYFVIRSIIRQILLFWDTFFIPLSPKLAELNTRYQRRALRQNLQVMFNLVSWSLVVLTVLLVGFSKVGLDIYTGSNYGEYAWLLRLMALMLVPYGLLTVVGSVVFILGEAIDRLKLELFTGLASLGLQLMLIPGLGLRGAGMAQVACFSLALLFGLWLAKKLKTGFEARFLTGLVIWGLAMVWGLSYISRWSELGQALVSIVLAALVAGWGWLQLDRPTRSWLRLEAGEMFARIRRK